jgi:hypothetical protein
MSPHQTARQLGVTQTTIARSLVRGVARRLAERPSPAPDRKAPARELPVVRNQVVLQREAGRLGNAS